MAKNSKVKKTKGFKEQQISTVVDSLCSAWKERIKRGDKIEINADFGLKKTHDPGDTAVKMIPNGCDTIVIKFNGGFKEE
jgi:hypothetical protein